MDVSGAVNRWVLSSGPEISSTGFAQIDLDNLLGAEPPRGAEIGVACLEHAMSALRKDVDLDGLLTLPIEPSTDWQEIPSLDDMLTQDWDYGPGREVPGLYLLHPLNWRTYQRVEEHVYPVVSRVLGPHLATYYRAWRTPHAGETEYNRCIYVRFIPEIVGSSR